MEPFVHLHVHSDFSVLDGKSKINKLVDLAIADGMKGMALTDHGVMYGIKEFSDYCAKVNKSRKKEGLEPFKPILGCEMYVASGKKEEKSKGNYHLVVLAKNYNGYKNLIKLVSRAWVDGYYYRARTDREDLAKYHEDLIVCSACIGGEIPRKILAGDIAGAEEACKWYHETFGDDFYLELQRHEVKDPNILANRETFGLQEEVNKVLIPMAKREGVKLVCTNDVHFEQKDYAEAHDILLCLGTQADYEDANRMRYTKEEYLKSQEEMNEIFSDVPEALSNTLEILDKVEIYNIEHGPIMPNFPIPADFGTEEDIRRQYSEEDLLKEFSSDENGNNTLPREEGMKKIESLGGFDKVYRIKFEAEYLKKLAYDGAKKLYGDPLPDNVKEQVDFELHVMKTMGFPGYFLIVSDFIEAARKDLGVIVGPGRGSAAGSTVAYCLGITRIDPLKYDLLFERFLNPDRVNLPDIDTDFDDDGRKWVLKWVMDKYGHENCAHIITYGAMATKNSIKDVARVMKLPLQQSNDLCKAIPERLPDGAKMNLGNAIKYTPELAAAEQSDDPVERDTIKYARMLEGTTRNTGIHACGFIICANPISDWVPASTAPDPDFPEERTMLTQYDGHVIESTGLIKMDFLGLKTLSELKEAVKNVKLSRGIDVDIDTIPIDDELTYQLYQKGQTVGTFQFESAGMQKYLRELHPTVFEDLIAMNALYRPGPMDYIPDFIKRKHDPSLISYDIPIMEKYLKDTYGITVYQEQVMLLSRLLANFTRGESDALRKAMGKKKKDIVDAMKPKFIEQGKANGHDPVVLEKIWSDWEKFASYAFNKSHATCYSWVAYQTGYMKAHYPAEFMAAIMTRRKNDIKEITKLMDECRSMGVPTLGPDINESFANFGANKKGEIRFGLAAIKGVPTAAVEAVIKERTENGPFTSIYDLMERIDSSSLNRKALECFALAGAFDCFPEVSREAFFEENDNGQRFSEVLIRYGQNYKNSKFEAATSLFGDCEEIETAKPEIPKPEKWSDLYRLNQEKDLVGIYLSAHPLDQYYLELNYGCNTKLIDMPTKEKLTDQEITFGGLVTGYEEKEARSGNTYGKIVIEDYSGKYELMLFGRDYIDYNKFGIKGLAIRVKGAFRKNRYNDRVSFSISSITPLDEVKGKLLNNISIKVAENQLKELAPIKESFTDSTSNRCQLSFRITTEDGRHYVDMRSQLKIPVTRQVIDKLTDMGFDFNIN
ncbi:MAG: DNA polymerase III subunit alpha [Bacteroidales bacterium]|nr:DNA polymerase III subunit alpha [Bacteroidales bacterium]